MIERLLDAGWEVVPERHDDGAGAYYVVKIAKDGQVFAGTGLTIDDALADVLRKLDELR